jgi:hypothetical protein
VENTHPFVEKVVETMAYRVSTLSFPEPSLFPLTHFMKSDFWFIVCALDTFNSRKIEDPWSSDQTHASCGEVLNQVTC